MTKRKIYRDKIEGNWSYWTIVDGRRCALTQWYAEKQIDIGKAVLVRA